GTRRERHEREIPAIADAVDADPCGIGKLLVAEPGGPARDVLKILSAPVAAVRFAPLPAVTRRPTRVRLKHHEAGIHEDLGRDVPFPVVLRRWPAVDVD